MSPPRIFISYRRDDSSGHAGRLYDALADHYGSESVFMDVDTIAPGSDFAEAIDPSGVLSLNTPDRGLGVGSSYSAALPSRSTRSSRPSSRSRRRAAAEARRRHGPIRS